jgi:hypothetical protein
MGRHVRDTRDVVALCEAFDGFLTSLGTHEKLKYHELWNNEVFAKTKTRTRIHTCARVSKQANIHTRSAGIHTYAVARPSAVAVTITYIVMNQK